MIYPNGPKTARSYTECMFFDRAKRDQKVSTSSQVRFRGLEV